MNESTKIELYATIESDLGIFPFNNEDDLSFHGRLVYSALSKWILILFSDRDFEKSRFNQVSKAHVTIEATNILESFLKIDPYLKVYFKDPEKTVIQIEQSYINLGYIDSGYYNFKSRNEFMRLTLNNNMSLLINSDGQVNKMNGIGLISKTKESDISLNDFFTTKLNSFEYFMRLIKNLNFKPFLYNTNNFTEIYNIYEKKWKQFNIENNYESKYFLIRQNKYHYLMLDNTNGTFNSAKINEIYSENEEKKYFKFEIWRIILGMCSYYNENVVAEVKNYCSEGLLISINKIIIPSEEMEFLRCLSWPYLDSLDSQNFILDGKQYKTFKYVLDRLCMEIKTSIKTISK